MKTCIAFALCVAVAIAAPLSSDKDAETLKYENNNIGVESYNFGYQTGNGIAAEEQAQLKNVGSENEALEVRGQFSYTAPDGVTYTVNYIANENGFQPQGAHIPKP